MVIAFFTQISPTLSEEISGYSFGVVPQFEPSRLYEVWEPILQSLYERTGIHLDLKTSPNIDVFEQQLKRARFDFVYINPYHMIKANQLGYEPLVRDHGNSLQGIIIVAKNSTIQRIEDLQGQTVVFPAPNALGASLVPRAELARRFGVNIHPWYVGSHSSVYLNVMLGQAIAGGGVYTTLSRQPPNIRNNLKIIYTTSKLAPHPIAAHKRVAADTTNSVAHALLHLGKTPEGRAMLAGIPISRIGRATMADYFALQELHLEEYYSEE